MDKIDLTQISLPLSSENFHKLFTEIQDKELNSKDLPKDLQTEYNRCNMERQRLWRQQMLKDGLMGQDD